MDHVLHLVHSSFGWVNCVASMQLRLDGISERGSDWEGRQVGVAGRNALRHQRQGTGYEANRPQRNQSRWSLAPNAADKPMEAQSLMATRRHEFTHFASHKLDAGNFTCTSSTLCCSFLDWTAGSPCTTCRHSFSQFRPTRVRLRCERNSPTRNASSGCTGSCVSTTDTIRFSKFFCPACCDRGESESRIAT